ncbi:MAG: hypothetical protein AAGA77_06770 [Bacteroidota bacterium]
MKKITLLLTAFVLIIAIQSHAQEGLPTKRSTGVLEYDDSVRALNRTRKGNRHRALRRANVQRKATHRQLRSMRRVARADGTISRRERSIIRQERRQLKRRNKRALKRRAIQRNQRRNGIPRNR